jgi:hypothetical protein
LAVATATATSYTGRLLHRCLSRMSFFICTALLSMSRERLGLDRLPAMVELADGVRAVATPVF